MVQIYLVRHGQDEDNAKGILNGHRDQPLTEIGIEQAEKLALRIKDTGLTFDKVYSSPLQRAFNTANVICDFIDLSPPEKLDILIERNFGAMSGQHTRDVEKLCAPDIYKTDTITYFLSPEGAETFPDLLIRAKKLLSFIEENHNDETVLLVSHGDFGKMIYAAFYDLDWKDTLSQFHFGNSEMLLLSKNMLPENSKVFSTTQYNS
jgi:probable phosphoglycerate mutase